MNKIFNILGATIRIDNGFYSVRLGSASKGFYAITPEIRGRTVRELQNLIKELLTVENTSIRSEAQKRITEGSEPQ